VLPYQSPDKSVGVVNCANSVCHGSVQPFKDSNVLQTEYVTWSRVDKHARAFQVLGNEQSQRIARNLGIGDPMQAKLCLDCHTHNVPETQRGERFKLGTAFPAKPVTVPRGGGFPRMSRRARRTTGTCAMGFSLPLIRSPARGFAFPAISAMPTGSSPIG